MDKLINEFLCTMLDGPLMFNFYKQHNTTVLRIYYDELLLICGLSYDDDPLKPLWFISQEIRERVSSYLSCNINDFYDQVVNWFKDKLTDKLNSSYDCISLVILNRPIDDFNLHLYKHEIHNFINN